MGPHRSRQDDLGRLEKTVRWIEETPPVKFAVEAPRKLNKAKEDKVDQVLRAAAFASLRSGTAEDVSPLPHGWLVQNSVFATRERLRSIGGPRELAAAEAAVLAGIALVNAEIHALPKRTPVETAPVEGSREEILYGFLEEVRCARVDRAEALFAWLARELAKDPLLDLVLSAGLEGVTSEVHRVIGVVEGAALLQRLGWEHAPRVLRPVVRLQASGAHGPSAQYELCRQEVASRELLRLARRRPPGQSAFGERDPQGFFGLSVEWASSAPDERRTIVAESLAKEMPLEDLAEALVLGSTLLFLQESLRQVTQQWSEVDVDRRMHLVTGVQAHARLVRLGTPGQRILGLLLAGSLPGIAELALSPRSPECGWWLPPAERLQESPGAVAKGVESRRLQAWESALQEGRPTGLLPLLAEHLGEGSAAEALEPSLLRRAPLQPRCAGLAMKLERGLADAYRATRSPHRWLHLWASALAQTLWPRAIGDGIESGREGLRDSRPVA